MRDAKPVAGLRHMYICLLRQNRNTISAFDIIVVQLAVKSGVFSKRIPPLAGSLGEKGQSSKLGTFSDSMQNA